MFEPPVFFGRPSSLSSAGPQCSSCDFSTSAPVAVTSIRFSRAVLAPGAERPMWLAPRCMACARWDCSSAVRPTSPSLTLGGELLLGSVHRETSSLFLGADDPSVGLPESLPTTAPGWWPGHKAASCCFPPTVLHVT